MTKELMQTGRRIRVKAGQKLPKKITGLVLSPVKIDQVGRKLTSIESRELPLEKMFLKAVKGPPMQKKMETRGWEIKVQEK
jgi:S-adenosylmethionine synthetase